jgi:hypothetical protein
MSSERARVRKGDARWCEKKKLTYNLRPSEFLKGGGREICVKQRSAR